MGRPVQVVASSEQPTQEFDTVEQDAAPGSVLAQLRVRAEAQREERTLDLPVGGAFGDRLVIRYRVLPPREWDEYAVLLTPDMAAGQITTPMSILNVRMMAAACQTVLWVEGGDETDLECRLDSKLAELLGHPLPANTEYADLTLVEIVEGLFASPMAVTTHAGRLVAWMQDPGAEPGEA